MAVPFMLNTIWDIVSWIWFYFFFAMMGTCVIEVNWKYVLRNGPLPLSHISRFVVHVFWFIIHFQLGVSSFIIYNAPQDLKNTAPGIWNHHFMNPALLVTLEFWYILHLITGWIVLDWLLTIYVMLCLIIHEIVCLITIQILSPHLLFPSLLMVVSIVLTSCLLYFYYLIHHMWLLRGNIGMVNMIENVKLSRYEGLDNTFKARNVAKVAVLEFMNEKEDRSMVAYNSMSKLKESVNWVKSSMEQDEAMLRFRKLCQPELDFSNSFKQALNWFNNIVKEKRWSTFYRGVLSVDYTKGRCISLAAKEFMFYEAFCQLASQHSEMRDINASSRNSHQFYRFMRACGLNSLGIHILKLGAAGCGMSVVMDRVKDAIIPLTVTDDDTTTDKYRIASYQQGELIISDEVAVTTSQTRARLICEIQQNFYNTRSMMSIHFNKGTQFE